MGLAFVGLIEGGDKRAAALASAQAAGLDAVALDNPAGSKLPAIAWTEKAKLPWNSAAAGLTFTDGAWPAIPPMKFGEGGPTGAPWVDSNGWFIRLARKRAPDKPVWVSVAPPNSGSVRTAQYELALADAWAYGARWVITLDDKLRAGLASGNAAAAETWKHITAAARFFAAHPDWSNLGAYANLAVVSDFDGPNEFLSHEILNLLPRRAAAYRIILKSELARVPLAGMKGIIYPDEQPPAPEAQKQLLAFVRAGGVLLAHPKWPRPTGVQAGRDPFGRWDVYPLGQGKLAVAKDEAQDPYLIASDAPLLVSRRYDVAHYFNFATLNGYYTVSPDGRKGLVHVLNYATRTWGHPVSITSPRKWTSARLWRFDTETPAALEIVPQGSGVEVHLPPFGAYAAIELGA